MLILYILYLFLRLIFYIFWQFSYNLRLIPNTCINSMLPFFFLPCYTLHFIQGSWEQSFLLFNHQPIIIETNFHIILIYGKIKHSECYKHYIVTMEMIRWFWGGHDDFYYLGYLWCLACSLWKYNENYQHRQYDNVYHLLLRKVLNEQIEDFIIFMWSTCLIMNLWNENCLIFIFSYIVFFPYIYMQVCMQWKVKQKS